MKLAICAVGRLRPVPEKDLTDEYLGRLRHIGKQLGITDIQLIEVEAKATPDPNLLASREAELLLGAVPGGARLIALDERGTMSTSEQFAGEIGAWRDDGVRAIAFLIGGANGLSPALRARADQTLAFGPMTWPHLLVRVLLTEQLYRSLTILAGHPYHRA